MSISVGVILGSNRPNRAGAAVADWFMSQVSDTPEVKYELIDLEKVDLPFLDEAIPPSQLKYSKDHTKAWSEQVAKHDAYIVITPEYNHSFPAVLKNALDFVYVEWAHKPIAFVSYGGSVGGSRAVEQLRQVAVELQMAPIRTQVMITAVWSAFEDGKLKKENLLGDPEQLCTDLLWWARALQTARQQS